MKVNVAGAGAGKTTKMAELIIEYNAPDGENIYCVAFTNAAAENIKEKVTDKLGKIPDNIKIGTIHSFLNQEFINPYYYFLFEQHFEALSFIDLPLKPKYKRGKLSELEKSNILHVSNIPEKAKWILHKKTGDTKRIKTIRESILSRFRSYCSVIFVDEAQDICSDIEQVIRALDNSGIEIILYGDPKQDVKGYGSFQSILNTSEDVTYITDCYRSPQKHLDISNMLARDSEKQTADKKNATGSIEIIFESELESIKKYIQSRKFGLSYVSRKYGRFTTHNNEVNGARFETLYHETYQAMCEKWTGQKSDFEIKRLSFYVTERMLESFDNTDDSPSSIISYWVRKSAFNRLSEKRFAQMASSFKLVKKTSTETLVVNSIERIKGLEAQRCLFILTTDLAPYLFQTLTADNKTKHLLYVALTRSMDHLTILITKKVEEKLTKQKIQEFFERLSR